MFKFIIYCCLERTAHVFWNFIAKVSLEVCHFLGNLESELEVHGLLGSGQILVKISIGGGGYLVYLKVRGKETYMDLEHLRLERVYYRDSPICQILSGQDMLSSSLIIALSFWL